LSASTSDNPPEGCGLYFLIRDGAVVYIGSSEYPSKRAWAHSQDRSKVFDAVVFLAVPDDQLLETEKHWIRTLCPVHNKAHNPRPDPDSVGWGGDPAYCMVRLPTECWHVLKALCRRTGRNMTTEAQIAIERRAAAQGIDFEPDWPAEL
jgi:hypothetical protein